MLRVLLDVDRYRQMFSNNSQGILENAPHRERMEATANASHYSSVAKRNVATARRTIHLKFLLDT
jgi:hypothetical protein